MDWELCAMLTVLAIAVISLLVINYIALTDNKESRQYDLARIYRSMRQRFMYVKVCGCQATDIPETIKMGYVEDTSREVIGDYTWLKYHVLFDDGTKGVFSNADTVMRGRVLVYRD